MMQLLAFLWVSSALTKHQINGMNAIKAIPAYRSCVSPIYD